MQEHPTASRPEPIEHGEILIELARFVHAEQRELQLLAGCGKVEHHDHVVLLHTFPGEFLRALDVIHSEAGLDQLAQVIEPDVGVTVLPRYREQNGRRSIFSQQRVGG